jgi:hypothetical protein
MTFKYILKCEENFSFFVFPSGLTVTGLARVYCIKDAGVVADSQTGIHNEMVKCLFVVNRNCIRKGF